MRLAKTGAVVATVAMLLVVSTVPVTAGVANPTAADVDGTSVDGADDGTANETENETEDDRTIRVPGPIGDISPAGLSLDDAPANVPDSLLADDDATAYEPVFEEKTDERDGEDRHDRVNNDTADVTEPDDSPEPSEFGPEHIADGVKPVDLVEGIEPSHLAEGVTMADVPDQYREGVRTEDLPEGVTIEDVKDRLEGKTLEELFASVSERPQDPSELDRNELRERFEERRGEPPADHKQTNDTVDSIEDYEQLPPEAKEQIPREAFEHPENVTTAFDDRPPANVSGEVDGEPPVNISDEPPEDYRKEPPEDYREEPPEDYRDEPPENYRKEPPEDYRDEPPEDYREEPPEDPAAYDDENDDATSGSDDENYEEDG